MPQNKPSNIRTLGEQNSQYFGLISVLELPGKDQALSLLTKASEIVIPIMEKRNWRLKNLCEFAPKDIRLLGRNWGRGSKVEIRLRPSCTSSPTMYVSQHMDI